jgi:hypothetical protein
MPTVADLQMSPVPPVDAELAAAPVAVDLGGLPAGSDARRLVLGPNDALVLTVPGPISRDMVEHIKAEVNRALGPNRKVLVLSNGMQLSVLGVDEVGRYDVPVTGARPVDAFDEVVARLSSGGGWPRGREAIGPAGERAQITGAYQLPDGWRFV